MQFMQMSSILYNDLSNSMAWFCLESMDLPDSTEIYNYIIELQNPFHFQIFSSDL